MSDDEASVSKRARQKQRRQVKKQAERRAAARARRRRVLMFVSAGFVVVGLAGAGVANTLRQRAAVAERQRVAEARLDELGCGQVEEQEIGSTAHLGGNELTTSPPQVVYSERPAAGGRMAEGTAEPGVYDEQVDERILVHNLEHGFVTMYYRAQADRAQIDALKAFARRKMDTFGTIIAAPWVGALPSEANFAVLSWGKRQLCRDFDEQVFLSYLERNHGGRSGAPEASVGGMGGNSSNPIRPDGEGPFLLPPLTAAPASEAATPAPDSSGLGSEAEGPS